MRWIRQGWIKPKFLLVDDKGLYVGKVQWEEDRQKNRGYCCSYREMRLDGMYVNAKSAKTGLIVWLGSKRLMGEELK